MDGTSDFVSIIMAAYNAEKTIELAICSVAMQTCPDWELIVINDCSTDRTAEIVSSLSELDSRIRLIQNQKNSGVSISRKTGMENANGNWISILDSDDIWEADKLEKELKFMKDTRAAFAYTAYEFGDENAKGTGRIVHPTDRLTYKKALSRTIIFTTTVMFDLEKIDKEEILMKQVPSEDTATWWRILRSGHIAYGLDENLAVYRRPARSLSSNKMTAIKRIWNLYRNEEGLGVIKSAYCFAFWALRATLRRI